VTQDLQAVILEQKTYNVLKATEFGALAYAEKHRGQARSHKVRVVHKVCAQQ